MDVVDTGRRRRWSDAEKHRIVEESLAGPRLVSATARRHEMTRSLLTKWRKLHAEGRLFSDDDAVPSFAPVMVVSPKPPAPPPQSNSDFGSDASRVEIVLTSGRRIVIGPGMDASALARMIQVVERA